MARESALYGPILKALRDAGGCFYKNHGTPFASRGRPDIEGCLEGLFVGIEVKKPGEEPTELQEYRLNQIRDAGGIGTWVTSLVPIVAMLQAFPHVCRKCIAPLTFGDADGLEGVRNLGFCMRCRS
jgi:hypothetical protein